MHFDLLNSIKEFCIQVLKIYFIYLAKIKHSFIILISYLDILDLIKYYFKIIFMINLCLVN